MQFVEEYIHIFIFMCDELVAINLCGLHVRVIYINDMWSSSHIKVNIEETDHAYVVGYNIA